MFNKKFKDKITELEEENKALKKRNAFLEGVVDMQSQSIRPRHPEIKKPVIKAASSRHGAAREDSSLMATAAMLAEDHGEAYWDAQSDEDQNEKVNTEPVVPKKSAPVDDSEIDSVSKSHSHVSSEPIKASSSDGLYSSSGSSSSESTSSSNSGSDGGSGGCD
jgi:hypothetical protein